MKNSDGITFSPSFKRVLIGGAVLNGMVGVERVFESFFTPAIYRKDFIQEYLMAKAILNGVDLYLPLPVLAQRFLSYANYSDLKHPTPHTPVMGLLSLPLGFLSYEIASVVSLIIELLCLGASLFLYLRWWGKPVKPAALALLFVMALGWVPVMEDLFLGQISICLLLLLIGAWLALRAGKNVLGGALLGGMIALKLMAWPIVLFLALGRRWSAVIGASVVVIAANLVSFALLGPGVLLTYYMKIGPLVSSIYRSDDVNYSAWTIGSRLFTNFGHNFQTNPLWPSSILATLFSVLVPVVVLFVGLRLALKTKRFDIAFSSMIIIGVFLNPIAWTHYLIFTTIPMAIIARSLWEAGFPKTACYRAACLFFPLSFAGTVYSQIAIMSASQTTPEGLPLVNFAAGLLTLIPAIALVGMLWLLRSDDLSQRQRSTSGSQPEKLLEDGWKQPVSPA